jgi:hypothetical protein
LLRRRTVLRAMAMHQNHRFDKRPP